MRLACHHCGSTDLWANAEVAAYESEHSGERFLRVLGDAESDDMDCGSCGVNLKLHRLVQASESKAGG